MAKNKKINKQLYLIKNKIARDNRGEFVKINYDKKEGLIQYCYSFNKKKHTLRGLHYQKKPYSEKKIITCIKGAIFDVVVNINKRSINYLKWKSFNLNEKNKHSLFVGEDYAHGFLTLTDNTIVSYQILGKFYPKLQAGILWDDKKINVKWPKKPSLISVRDKNFKQLV